MKKIPLTIRSQIISDVLDYDRANILSSRKTFNLLRYLENESEHLAWRTFLDQIRFYLDIFESTESYGDLQLFLRNLITPIYNKLTWKKGQNDTWSDRKLRSIIVRYACEFGVQDCIDKAQNAFSKLIANYENNEYLKKRLLSSIY